MNRYQVDLPQGMRDRALGCAVGMAVGNALGSGYAFSVPPQRDEIRMRAGDLGPYKAGEWADDTAMAIPILTALAAGKNLLDPATQDEVVGQWVRWAAQAKDVAPIISTVLESYDAATGAESVRAAALTFQAAGKPSAAGNASLMRTTPITLGFLHDPGELAQAALTYSGLTHANPEAGEACVLWNLAVRTAILTGGFDLVGGLTWIPEDRRDWWENLITRAEIGSPRDFAIGNGRVSQLVQTIWSAVIDGDQGYEQTLRTVIAAGGDTATSGAVAGGILGARWGMSAIPLQWRRRINGWPGIRDAQLTHLVYEALTAQPWPDVFEEDPMTMSAVQHPCDPGVWLGGIAGLRPLPAEVDAVVSLTPLGAGQKPVPPVADENQISVWLLDSEDPADNPNLEFVAEQTVDLLSSLRSKGHIVYLHCVDGGSRTAFISALYGARIEDVPATKVWPQIQEVLPHARLNTMFERVLRHYG